MPFWNAFFRRCEPFALGIETRDVAVVLLLGAKDRALHRFVQPEVNHRVAERLAKDWIKAFLSVRATWARLSLWRAAFIVLDWKSRCIVVRQITPPFTSCAGFGARFHFCIAHLLFVTKIIGPFAHLGICTTGTSGIQFHAAFANGCGPVKQAFRCEGHGIAELLILSTNHRAATIGGRLAVGKSIEGAPLRVLPTWAVCILWRARV